MTKLDAFGKFLLPAVLVFSAAVLRAESAEAIPSTKMKKEKAVLPDMSKMRGAKIDETKAALMLYVDSIVGWVNALPNTFNATGNPLQVNIFNELDKN
jgi:hypothetical protein